MNIKRYNEFINESESKPSLEEVNAHIQTKYPELEVAKHHDTAGSYYWYSDNEDVLTYLSGLYSTTVEGVARTEQQSLEKWMKEADDIMKDFKI